MENKQNKQNWQNQGNISGGMVSDSMGGGIGSGIGSEMMGQGMMFSSEPRNDDKKKKVAILAVLGVLMLGGVVMTSIQIGKKSGEKQSRVAGSEEKQEKNVEQSTSNNQRNEQNEEQQSVEQPTQPAQPAQPARPTQPAQPAQPARPTQPAQPAQPARPAQPENRLTKIARVIERHEGFGAGTLRDLRITKEDANFIDVGFGGGGAILKKVGNEYEVLHAGQGMFNDVKARLLQSGVSEEFLYGSEDGRLKRAYVLYENKKKGITAIDVNEMKRQEDQLEISVSKRDGNFLSASIKTKGEIGGGMGVFSKNNPQREYVCLAAGQMISQDEQALMSREGVPKHLYMSSGR